MFCKRKKSIFTFSANIRDSTSFLWVDFFRDIAEKFVGIKAEDFVNILLNNGTEKAEDNEQIKTIYERKEYRTYSFVGKVRENVLS